MEHLKFVIEASEAEAMAKNVGLSVIELLPLIAKSAQKLARVPISSFSVGAAGLTSDGRIFLGVNLEFPGLPLHHSVHAEQFLVTNTSIHGQTYLKNVVVTAYPCGHCRQFLQEIRGAPEIQILVRQNNGEDRNSIDQVYGISDGEIDGFRPLSYFLPHRFGPDDLLDKDVPLILETHENGLNKAMNGDSIDGKEKEDKGKLSNGFSGFDKNQLISSALEAANQSHAPYSGCPSGVAIMDKDGKIYKGSYLESAAYNPSLGPAQAALVAYLTAGGGGYDRIVAAALAEKEDPMVKQEDTCRLFFGAISPKYEFHVVHCKAGSNLKK